MKCQNRQICEDGKQISGNLGLGVGGLEGMERMTAKRCPFFGGGMMNMSQNRLWQSLHVL